MSLAATRATPVDKFAVRHIVQWSMLCRRRPPVHHGRVRPGRQWRQAGRCARCARSLRPPLPKEAVDRPGPDNRFRMHANSFRGDRQLLQQRDPIGLGNFDDIVRNVRRIDTRYIHASRTGAEKHVGSIHSITLGKIKHGPASARLVDRVAHFQANALLGGGASDNNHDGRFATGMVGDT